MPKKRLRRLFRLSVERLISLKRATSFIINWFPAIVWMIIIFSFSSIPASELPRVKIPHVDKIVHIFEYAILGILLTRAILKSSEKIGIAKILILVIIIASAYAIFDEWHQQFVPGRDMNIFDFLADFIGAIIGLAVYNMRGFKCLK